MCFVFIKRSHTQLHCAINGCNPVKVTSLVNKTLTSGVSGRLDINNKLIKIHMIKLGVLCVLLTVAHNLMDFWLKMACSVLFFGLFLLFEKVSSIEYLCNANIKTHGINTALLTINTDGAHNAIIVQLVSENCHTCPLQNVTYMHADQNNCTVIVDTRWPTRLAIISNSSEPTHKNCSGGNLDTLFEENGMYSLYVIQRNGTLSCDKPFSLNDPADSNTTVYATLGIFAALALVWITYKKLKLSRLFYRILYQIAPQSVEIVDPETYSEQDLGIPTNGTVEAGTPRKERLRSLDTMRGISLVIMMFVNYGGADYWFFNHSKWNGLTVADLVFPWFVWIMGTSMAYSFQSLQRRLDSKCSIFLKVVRRSIILFVMGLIIDSSGSQDPFDFTKMRIMGVLQRFSLTYFITASIHLMNTRDAEGHRYVWWNSIRDILLYWPEWIAHLLIIIIWIFITFFLPVPGCPTGYIGPGGLANDSNGQNVSLCTGGAAGYVDRTILGDHHVYSSPTCKEIYLTTVHYDPEGLLGTLTSCFLCFLGLQAGKILITFKEYKARLSRFLLWAIILGLIAGALCEFKQNDGLIPVNKNLWSLSFILALSSMGFILLGFCYLTIDVYEKWSGAPFYYPGMNSIVIYMCHEIFSQPFQTFWNIEPTTHAVNMLINVWDVSVWVLLSYFLFCKKIFISV